MGCGSSKNTSGADERDRLASALAAHLSERLGLHLAHPEIQGYVQTLNAQGLDLPSDFDDLAIEVLQNKPFSFKPGHLEKVRECESL